MVLYAGPLQMLYDRGFLRYIAYEDSEILRMIYFALRDEHWDTCEHVITHEEKDISWETFTVKYNSVNRRKNEDVIRWSTTIEGLPDSSIQFTIDGEVLKEIKKNRAGFCILHPLQDLKGQPVEVTQPNGTIYQGNFPTAIDPKNPFKNIKRMKWKFRERWYELTFEGDVFETEDQRNWIDTSFKTFCTPADLPIPVTLQAGAKIHQRVMFRPLEKLHPITSHDTTVIHLEKKEVVSRLPKVGIMVPSDEAAHPLQAADVIKSINLDHALIEVIATQQDWIRKFSHDCESAYALGVPLSIALTLPEAFQNSLDQFILLLQQNRLNVRDVLLLSDGKPVTDQKLADEISRLKSAVKGLQWGAGTSGDFKDLNRNRFDARNADFISFSAHPQVHAFDDRTILENKDGLCETGRSAASIYPGKQIHISPVTLQKRSIEKADVRQKTDLAALWAFGALRAASEAHVSAITLYASHGRNGIVSNDGKPYPALSLLGKVTRFKNHDMIVLSNSEPLLADAMLFTSESSTTLLMVNYTDDLQTIRYGRNEFQVPPLQLIEVNLSGT